MIKQHKDKIYARSLALFMDHLKSQSGFKMTKGDFEEILEQVTLADHLINATVAALPCITLDLEGKYTQRIRNGDPMIMVELESAVHFKTENYGIRDSPSIAALINSQAMDMPPSAMASLLRQQQDELDQDAWNLFVQELDYDTKCVRAHLENVAGFYKTQRSEKDLWRSKVRKDQKKSVQSFVESLCTVHVVPERLGGEPFSEALAAYKCCKTMIANRLQLQYENVLTVGFYNGAAPALIRAHMLEVVPSMMRHILTENDRNNIISLDAVFSWKKGDTYKENAAMEKLLANKAHSGMDKTFYMLYKDKCDVRDERPMVYPDHIHTLKGSGVHAYWKKNDLCTMG